MINDCGGSFAAFRNNMQSGHHNPFIVHSSTEDKAFYQRSDTLDYKWFPEDDSAGFPGKGSLYYIYRRL